MVNRLEDLKAGSEFGEEEAEDFGGYNLAELIGLISTVPFSTVLFFSLGIGAFIFIYRFTREPVIPTAGFMMILLVGSFVRAPTVSVLGVLVVVLSLMAGMFIFRKFAS